MGVRILGIDPGFDRMGVCILEKEGSAESLLFSTCITTSKHDVFEARLHAIGKELEDIIKRYTPSEAALEKLFFAKNQTTAINVAEVRGVVLYLSSVHGLSVHEYSPPEVKVAVTGYGKATKQDVALMVPKILKIPQDSKMLDDEVDAIAVALTHSAHRKKLSWK